MRAGLNNSTETREKRARAIAIMGLVRREGSRYYIQSPSVGERRVTYEVWRDEQGKVNCSCAEFQEQVGGAPFTCEHILAVKFSLQPKVRPEQETPEAIPSATPTKAEPMPAQAESEEKRQPATSRQLRAAKEQPVVKRENSDAAAQPSEVRVVPEQGKPQEANAMRRFNQESANIKAAPEAEREAKEAATEAPAQSAVEKGEEKAQIVSIGFAGTLRTLRQPIDARLIKTREGWTDYSGNKHYVEYVEWHTVADILDRVAPSWSHAVRNITQVGETVAVTASITIDGVTREGIGTGTAENETGIKKAEHDALKRAAVKFGIARDLYQRESEVIEQTGAAATGGFPRNPLAKSVGDLATPKQLGMIRAIGREIGVDVEAECQRVLNLTCKTDELSRRAASSFIDHLKQLQQEAEGDELRRAS